MISTLQKITIVAAIVVAAMFVQSANAGHGCAQCGCNAKCQKVCRKVCTTKKVTTTCWAQECEDFCKASRLGRCGDGCCTSLEAACAQVHTRKKLMRKTVTVEVPVVKWVVEDLCQSCNQKLAAIHVRPPAPVPVAKMFKPKAPMVVQTSALSRLPRPTETRAKAIGTFFK